MRISVFGSSSCEYNSLEDLSAWQIGRMLAIRGIKVVNGARAGVMEAVSAGACKEHGSVIGVMRNPSSMCNKFVTETIICDPEGAMSYELGMNIRTGKMLESDGFVVIMGPSSGPGTYKELVGIIECELSNWNPQRPCAVLFPETPYNSELAAAFGISLKSQVFARLVINDGYAGWLRVFTKVSDELIDFVTGKLT